MVAHRTNTENLRRSPSSSPLLGGRNKKATRPAIFSQYRVNVGLLESIVQAGALSVTAIALIRRSAAMG
jgi:hypothetical protein